MSNAGASNAVAIRATAGGLQLDSLDAMWRFATAVSKSGLTPKGFNTTEAVLVAIQAGAELGFGPWASLQNLIVIRGKVSMEVATARALVEASEQCEWIKDNMAELSGVTKWENSVFAEAEAKRVGREPVLRRFSVADAKRAGLWGGKPDSAWATYPGRMLYCRALGFVLRDAFPDILKGLKTAEEMRDYRDVGDVTPALKSGDTVPQDDLNAVAEELEDENQPEDGDNAETDKDGGFFLGGDQ